MVTDFSALRPTARFYITGVVLAGAVVIGSSVHQLFVDPISNRWLILAILTLLTGSFSVKVSSINAYISVSEAFVFASILMFGTAAGTATVVIECLVILLWMKREGRLLHRVLFNMAAPSVAVWTAGTAFYLLSGIQPYSMAFTPLPALFLPLLAFTALYFLLNSWLVAIAVGLESGRSSREIWLKNFAWLSVNYFSGASLAALIVTYTKQQLDFGSLLVIVPLLVVSYLTFRTAMGRAEDSYSHLSELNRLYLSTIETLAMAIDAKDQVTHGHIRRVQAYAVGLAKAVGVSDEKLLKAIEAAALLHDMGKLAVPEHILNKPGKLTAAEFEKMKLHASFGADMLSAIDFPYPVVPIVRHHHENWNGTGYPTGIRGTDIPIGARILSVVDCFDALTSDRPYRPRLSDQDALTILMERRGSMYDPLVVDTFVRVYRDIAPSEAVTMDHPSAGNSPRSVTPRLAAAPVIAAAVAEPSRPIQRGARPTLVVPEIADAINTRLRAQVPFALAILYVYDADDDELVARYVAGDTMNIVGELRITLGERLSGWVAANRKTILNSDPALDLGELAARISPKLLASLSVALVSEEGLVGVLALYSTSPSFSEEHRRVAEAAAHRLAQDMTSPPAARAVSSRDAVTSLPLASTIPDALKELSAPGTTSVGHSLIFIETVGLSEILVRHGRPSADRALVLVAEAVRSCLLRDDLLFRRGDDEFVAVVSHTEVNDVWALAKQIREAVRTRPLQLDNGTDMDLHVSTHGIASPSDEASLRDLLASRHGIATTTPSPAKDSRVH